MATQEKALRKNDVITQLVRSEHGKLAEYVPIARLTATEDPEFLAHVIAWDALKGQIRDTKVALPIVSLSVPSFDEELRENSLAHLLKLDPRMLAQAVRFARDPAVGIRSSGRKRLAALVEEYLRHREANPRLFESAALQHRQSMKELYTLNHIKPGAHADKMVVKGEAVGIFRVLRDLKTMAPQEAAGAILKHKIPFLALRAAIGQRLKEPDIALALIGQMSPTELVTNTKMLERMGVKTNPALRAAFEAGLERVATSKKATLKTTKAAEQMTDTALKSKLQAAQEKQLKVLGGIDGDWLVLGDRSGSMAACVEGARQVAAVLAKMVKGKVHLVFFDTTPQYYDATGKTYEEIKALTSRIVARGSTSIGCGLQYVLDKGWAVDGIAVVSDAMENAAPLFANVLKAYEKKHDAIPTTYLYRFGSAMRSYADCDLANSMQKIGVDMPEFAIPPTFDYYSLPNLVQTMRVQRYSLIDEIMETPLLTREQVLKGGKNGNSRQAA